MKQINLNFTSTLLSSALLLSALCCVGCIDDDPVDMSTWTDAKGNKSDVAKDAGADTDDRGVCPEAIPTDTAIPLPMEIVLEEKDYEEWLKGDDTWAPMVDENGESIEPMICDETHYGWLFPRCFECHGVGMGMEPVNHDPRMQFWSWSCSRGFPGTSCHGHGPNGADMFNHEDDPAYVGCTRDFCHDQYGGERRYENHGFNDTPDSYCNACHDYFWEDWPDEDTQEE